LCSSAAILTIFSLTKEKPMDDCTEPDGNEETDFGSAHNLMLDEQGYCPWCGEEAEAD
jgi:hypothetical protein